MISGWGATILMRGIAICSVVGLFLEVLSGGSPYIPSTQSSHSPQNVWGCFVRCLWQTLTFSPL